MANLDTVADAPDTRLVDRMRARLEKGYWPRVHCLLIVTVSTAVAFLTSVLLLVLRIHWMAIRYGAAALAGYATVLLLLRGWVHWKWSRASLNADGSDVLDVANNLPIDLDLPSLPDAPMRMAVGGGGRSGGAGASGGWDSASHTVSSVKSGGGKSGGWSLDLDGDDLFWLIVALAAAFAGLIAVAYVIWIAPTLLAEAIVNGAVAGKVYHGMRKREDDFWTSQIVRRTAVSGVPIISKLVRSAPSQWER